MKQPKVKIAFLRPTEFIFDANNFLFHIIFWHFYIRFHLSV